jgi:UDP-N-acetylmuramoylalanine--D-glutamate ligase
MKQGGKISILGAGESGAGAAYLASKRGLAVFVSDSGPVQPKYAAMLDQIGVPWESGRHTQEKVLDADIIVKSPGIPGTAPIVKAAIAKGIPVVSELEFAYKYKGSSKLVCVTGSNGKTTTSSLIYEMLKMAGFSVGLGGNIGQSFARQVADFKKDYYVLEISSFQLDNMYHFKADIAIITNITPDHLDRYEHKFELYIDSKFRILQNMTEADVFVFSADDPVLSREIKARQISLPKIGVSLSAAGQACADQGQINVKLPNTTEFSMQVNELALTGKHNVANSLVTAVAGKVLNIKNELIRECLSSFKAVEHRLQKLPYKVGGVQFINDSKATNVNSVWYALESMDEPTIWIAGGIDKGNNYQELMPLVQQKVKALVCLGKDNKELLAAFGGVVPVYEAASMAQAVSISHGLADKGDTVLLSPACASFDFFKNYEDRGKQFCDCVRSL